MRKFYKINEIFYSLQGEGHHTGTPAIFIRFAGCNLHCNFCDTDHKNGTKLTFEQILTEVKRYPDAAMIVLTGGEPSLYVDEEFITKLKRDTMQFIAIETNGTNPLPDNIDWITLSPKNNHEGGSLQPVQLKECNELKVVYTGQPLEQYFNIPAEHYYLQPCSSNDPAADKLQTDQTIKAILKDNRWKLSLQTHKLLNIR